MLETLSPFIGTVVAAAALATAGCSKRERAESPPSSVAGMLDESLSCAGDSLRPAVAAPAQGLWVYERPFSPERVAALIGPPRSTEGALAVTRAVESVEVRHGGDTIRTRVEAVSVTLELLPPLGAAVSDTARADTLAGSQPVATYALSPRVWLAAYEPCATSRRGPRLRYLRRDAAGRIVTDVVLRRASNE